MSKTI